jgi:glucose/arabinose dehydrogenase
MPISRRRFLIGLAAVAAASIGLAATFQAPGPQTGQPKTEALSAPTQVTTETGAPRFRSEVFLDNLDVPWSLEFAPNGTAFFTERKGLISALNPNAAKPRLFAEVPVEQTGEGGLLGLALSPEFEHDGLVYVYHTYRDEQSVWNRVVRYKDSSGSGVGPQTILDKIPGARIHDGGRIRFGPDQKLYITTGDSGNRSLAQDPKSLAGKILRLNSDGSIPSDNPFPDSPVYSYGHRNPQGIDWHPLNGRLYETEHGPTGEDGRVANDEINLIEPGRNYGWPEVVGSSNDARFVNPLFNTGDNETWAPSGCSFYKGDVFRHWRNSLFVATLRGSHLHRFLFDPETGQVRESEYLLQGSLGRLRDVVEGPDGVVYVLTSNRDGRGQLLPGDDRILRLVPD